MVKTVKKSISEILRVVIRTIICCAAVVGILYAFYYLTFVRLPRGEIQKSCASPTGEYTVNLYLCNGGATVDYAIRGEVVYNKAFILKRKKDIYWNYHEQTADCIWITDHVVIIYGTELDVRYDSYDWRYTE